jgi:hypothetical protein
MLFYLFLGTTNNQFEFYNTDLESGFLWFEGGLIRLELGYMRVGLANIVILYLAVYINLF